jgi:hypothetical protein
MSIGDAAAVPLDYINTFPVPFPDLINKDRHSFQSPQVGPQRTMRVSNISSVSSPQPQRLSQGSVGGSSSMRSARKYFHTYVSID